MDIALFEIAKKVKMSTLKKNISKTKNRRKLSLGYFEVLDATAMW